MKELLSSVPMRLFLNKLYLNGHKPLSSRGCSLTKINWCYPLRRMPDTLESSGWTTEVKNNAPDSK